MLYKATFCRFIERSAIPIVTKEHGSRDSVVCIVTGYGLDGAGIESQWGARFSSPVQTIPEAHPASCTMVTESFPGVKRPGRGVDQPLPCSVEVKERVELYFYSLSGPSWPVLR